ncbi:MAG TPA: protein kinase [Terriglobales bacterium]|nr:protein kinase [Terriglobales bacterium]
MPAPMLHTGGMLGRYRLLEQIGAGGMGIVYRARDERLGRDVAIKLLAPGSIRSVVARHRVRNEAMALSRLSHPNIETIFEFDTQDDSDFLVVELIEGVSLDELLKRGPLPQTLAVSLTMQLLRGLAAAHEKGIIHRDLKPSNLRLTHESFLKILDFGIAHLGDEEQVEGHDLTTETHSTVFTGTLAYMSPEQLRGAPPDARSDIYGAGLVLYQMCVGRPPYSETGALLIDAILNRPAPPPVKQNKQISEALQAVILKALEKDPSKRYQSAREMLRDLDVLDSSLRTFPIRSRRNFMIGLSAVVLLVLMLVASNFSEIQRMLASASGTYHIDSLAVLPLENSSHDPDQEYIADGITEALITDLGEIRGLRRVISHGSVVRYKTEQKPAADISKELNVDGVVEGSISRSGSSVEVALRLLSSNGKELWSKFYRRELRDLVSLQREIALAIATEVRVPLLPAERSRLLSHNPVDPAAEVAYLRGNYLKFGTSAQQQKAKEYFEQAISIDPNYAPAYAGLADYYWGNLQSPPLQTMPKAEDYALKALNLDPTLAHAHVSLGSIRFYADWNWEEAEKELKRAIELNPSDADAHHMYSVYLSALGRSDEALAELRRAQELDPLYVWTQITQGFAYYFAHQYDTAIRQCRRALELEPNSAGAYDCLGLAYLAKGSYLQAIAACQRAVEFSSNDPARIVGLGRAYALSGNMSEAHKILNDLNSASEHRYIPPYFLAELHAALGDKEQAMNFLETSYRERDIYIAWLKVDSALDPVRSDPRFEALLQRVGFPAGKRDN